MYDNLLAHVPTDLWIGGKWRKASDNQRFDVIDPATERKVADVASASIDDAKAALKQTLALQPDLALAHVENNNIYADPADRARFREGLVKAGLNR